MMYGIHTVTIADKLLINVLSVSLWVNGTLPTPLVGLWLVKDVVLMTATYLYVAQKTAGGTVWDPTTTPLQVNPTLISKVNTALQFVTLAVGIAHPALVAAAQAATMATATAAATTPEHVVALAPMMVAVLAGPALPALCWLTGATTLASFGSYVGHSAFTEVVVRHQQGKR